MNCECEYNRVVKARFRRTIPNPTMDGSWGYETVYQYLCGIHAKHPTLPWFVHTWYGSMPLAMRKPFHSYVGTVEPIPQEGEA